MDLVPIVFSSGWASGMNAYLVVLVLGLSDRVGEFDDVGGVRAGQHGGRDGREHGQHPGRVHQPPPARR